MPFAVGTVRDLPVRALKLCGLTWSGEVLWFSEGVLNRITSVEPVSGEVGQHLACPDVRTDLTTMSGRLVQVAGEARALRVLDPVDGSVVTELPNPRPGGLLCGLEATQHGVWFGYEDRRIVDLRDAGDLSLIDTIPVSHPPAGVTVTDDFLAYADYRGGTVNLVDLGTRREVARYDAPGNPTGLTWDGSRIWYCDHTTLQLRAIDLPGISNA
ncbi:hypothetical protein ACWEHA_00465 [Amycolatopsis nivea]